MTTGTKLTGGTSPYSSGVYRSWSGSDDPSQKKRWNSYTLSAFTRTVYVAPGKSPMGSGDNMSSIFTSDDDLRLLDKLSSRIRQHDFNAGVFIGTSHQLTHQVVSTIRGVAKTVTLLKRGDLSGAVRSLARSVGASDVRKARGALKRNDVAGAHLSLVYGWLPTFSDVYEAAKAFEVVSQPPRSSTVTVSRSHAMVVDCSQSDTLYTCPGEKVSRKRIRLIITESLSEARSLGLLDPRPIIWELMPWSFVADWFIPIGTHLGVLGTIPHVKGIYRVSEKTTVSAPACTPLGVVPYYDGSHTSYKEVWFRRYAESTSMEIPLPRFRGFKELYGNSARIANAVALLSQKLR